MSNIDVRYIVEEGIGYGGKFDVYDQQEERSICVCLLRKDAGMIAGLLNIAEAICEKEEFEKQVEGVRKEMNG